MTERPILFSDAMARAILAGTKTQTRRVMTPQPIEGCGAPVVGAYHPIVVRRGIEEPGPERWGASTEEQSWPCPYGQPGDRLWVREAWRAEERASDLVDGVRFRSDDAFVPIQNTPEAAEAWADAYDNGRHKQRWRPSIFLPRWASRLTLEVTSVRVERVQSISEEDARAEGVTPCTRCRGTGIDPVRVGHDPDYCQECGGASASFTHRDAFEELWDAINGTRPGCSWEASPWVWCVSFKRVSNENQEIDR